MDRGDNSRSVALSAAASVRTGSKRAISAPGNCSSGSSAGDRRARRSIMHGVRGAVVANQSCHRRTVRAGGGEVGEVATAAGEVATAAAAAAARHVSTTTVIAR